MSASEKYIAGRRLFNKDWFISDLPEKGEVTYRYANSSAEAEVLTEQQTKDFIRSVGGKDAFVMKKIKRNAYLRCSNEELKELQNPTRRSKKNPAKSIRMSVSSKYIAGRRWLGKDVYVSELPGEGGKDYGYATNWAGAKELTESQAKAFIQYVDRLGQKAFAWEIKSRELTKGGGPREILATMKKLHNPHRRVVTTVHNLSTYKEHVYSLSAREAVTAAYAQSRGDWNTWDYAKKYGKLVKSTPSKKKGSFTWICGDFAAIGPKS